MRSRKKIVIGLISLVGLLAAAELFCRFYLGLGDPPLVRSDPQLSYLFIGPRTYHRFGNTISYNSFSMRSREFDARRKDPDEIRVVVAGNSIINGGAQTDQSQIMTAILENHLSAKFHKPAVVMNISAGGWGPPNYWAYIKRYGIFEANLVVIVVISGDASNSPTFEPVAGVSPDFPDKTPTFALSEALFRYLPRYLPGTAAAKPRQRSQGEIDQALGAFRSVITYAKDRGTPVLVAQFAVPAELGQAESEGHRWFREICEEMSVPRVEMSPPFEAAVKAGQHPYRDETHPNVLGQQIMEDTLEPVVLETLAKSKTPPATVPDGSLRQPPGTRP